MITALLFCLKCLYWLVIGWWLEPIKLIIEIRHRKMENTVLKYNYKKIKEEQKKED